MIALTALAVGWTTEAEAAPLVAQMGVCAPPANENPAWTSSSRFTTDQALGVVPGFGNDAGRRKTFFKVWWSYAAAAAGDDVATAISATQRVEVCRLKASDSSVDCPAWTAGAEGASWLLFDSATSPAIATAKVKADPASDITNTTLNVTNLPLDWDDPTNEGVMLFLLVNAVTAPTTLADVTGTLAIGGFCPVPYRLAKVTDKPQGSFVTSTPSAPGQTTTNDVRLTAFGIPNPFPTPAGWTLSDPCTGSGNKANFLPGSPCVKPAALQQGLDLVMGVDQWQRNSAQNAAQLGFNAVVQTWQNGVGYNGSTCTVGQPCPSKFFSHPYKGGAGYAWDGLLITGFGTYKEPFEWLSTTAGGGMRNINHEYFHGLGESYSNRFAQNALYFDLLFLEPAATTAEVSSCLTNYPGNTDGTTVDSAKCITGRSLYGFYKFGGLVTDPPLYLAFPENPLASYPGVLFYKYAASQFAYRKEDSPKVHPGGINSISPVLFTAAQQEQVLNLRRPDEGLDLVGYLMQAMAEGGQSLCNGVLPASASITERFNCVLDKYLGKDFDEVLLDFHTMLVLKDYAESDPRWKMTWLGDYNAGAASFLFPGASNLTNFPGSLQPVDIRTMKPFVKATTNAVPGAGFPKFPSDLLPDQLTRVRRAQDTYTCLDPSNCNLPANRQIETLAPTQTRSSAQPLSVLAMGSSYVSLHPDPAYGTVEVALKAESGQPRFRVFTIDGNGVPRLATACNVGQLGSESCPIGPDGSAVVQVPVNSNGTVADEILVVTSVGRGGPAKYSWRMGPSQAQLRIVSPTTANPVHIGTVGGLSPKPFLVSFTAVDGAEQPVDVVNPDNLVVKVDGQAIPPVASCPAGENCAITLTGYSGGTYQALVHVPASMYPAVSDRLDLTIEAAGTGLQPATQTQALEVSGVEQPSWTSLVLDVSGSMLFSSKMAAMKAAAHLVVDSHRDNAQDQISLNVFSTLSLTVTGPQTVTAATRQALHTAIDGLSPAGSTALGSGLLRGSSQLFVNNPGAAAPRYGLILMTDGLSNCPHAPSVFLDSSPAADPTPPATGDCSASTVPTAAPWPANGQPTSYANPSSGPLGYKPRKAAGLPVPVVSTVFVGPDADAAYLSQLSQYTGGSTFSVQGIDGTTPMFFKFVDSFLGARNSVSQRQRVMSKQTTTSTWPSFAVEAGVGDMVVSVYSPSGYMNNVRLRSPSNAVVSGVSTSNQRMVFRLSAPQAGTWSLEPTSSTSIPASQPLYVESAVRGGCELSWRADIEGALTVEPGGDDRRWAGREMVLSAVRGSPSATQQITAEIEVPTATAVQIVTVPLFDDGNHQDGAANDGRYAARFPRTSMPGLYTVRFKATGPAATACQREQTVVVPVRAAADLDLNGLPDWWQARHGLPSQASSVDSDRDGLTDLQEFQQGTLPTVSDSDGGGESDASEVASNRDPRDPSNDRLGQPRLAAFPGNASVLLTPGVLMPPRTNLEVQSASTEQGPFQPVLTATTDVSGGVRITERNDTQRCYVARLTSSSRNSGWSNVVCATPRQDPAPPVVHEMRLEGPSACVNQPTATIAIDATDDGTSRWYHDKRVVDPAAVSSGITDVRVRTGNVWGNWSTFQGSVTVVATATPSTTVVVQLRDQAGNVSEESQVTVYRCMP
jgi:hypothetical protein